MTKAPRNHMDSPKRTHQSVPPSAPPPLRDRSAALAALGALYQGEKTDASYIFNTAMAMMGIAAAYLIGATGFVATNKQGPLPWPFLLLLPMPLWIIAFHSLITLCAMNHGVSVQAIENELFGASELTVRRDLVGSAAGDRIMDIGVSKPIHRLTTMFVYGGIGTLVLGFTIYVLHSAYAVIRQDPSLVRFHVIWIASAVYFVLLVMAGFSWRIGLRDINAGRKEIANRVLRFGIGAIPGS
jgi:hypothetical protein